MPDVILTDDARRLDLQQQKKRAKELRRDLAAGDVGAIRRFRACHPKVASLRDADVIARFAKVTDAQLVIARELGLASWPRLRRHIERWTAARDAIAAGAEPVDRDMATTHVRCGSDIREGLERAGIVGTFVEFSDPYCQGPVPREGNLLETRASFISRGYGISFDHAKQRLQEELDALRATLRRPRVVLWFEHDSFDQLILARILAFYGDHGVPERLELVCIDGFPAVDRFNGLGHLSPAALRMLWDDRRVVGDDLLALGARTWNALRDPNPLMLHAVTQSSEILPPLGRAVLRHLQELPWTVDGLSLTQRLTLNLLEEGAMTAGALFRRLTLHAEPLVFLGDLMYWAVLEELSAAGVPAIAVDDGPRGEQWRERRVSLTRVGRQLVGGEGDWMACEPAERWVGGVCLRPGTDVWRWDPQLSAPVRR